MIRLLKTIPTSSLRISSTEEAFVPRPKRIRVGIEISQNKRNGSCVDACKVAPHSCALPSKASRLKFS